MFRIEGTVHSSNIPYYSSYILRFLEIEIVPKFSDPDMVCMAGNWNLDCQCTVSL